jgi:hypothetical protein
MIRYDFMTPYDARKHRPILLNDPGDNGVREAVLSADLDISHSSIYLEPFRRRLAYLHRRYRSRCGKAISARLSCCVISSSFCAAMYKSPGLTVTGWWALALISTSTCRRQHGAPGRTRRTLTRSRKGSVCLCVSTMRLRTATRGTSFWVAVWGAWGDPGAFTRSLRAGFLCLVCLRRLEESADSRPTGNRMGHGGVLQPGANAVVATHG